MIPSPNRAICDQESEQEECIHIARLQSTSALRIWCEIDSCPLYAVVDTAADVTIISEQVYGQLVSKPECLKTIKMYAAGKDQSFHAKLVGPLNIKLGDSVIKTNVFVAPIFDSMLLGIDLLKKLQVTIDIGKQTMTCMEQVLPLRTRDESRQNSTPSIKLVQVASKVQAIAKQKISIPANSEYFLTLDLPTKIISPYFCFEPERTLEPMMARALYKSSEQPTICIINVGEEKVIKAGETMGLLDPVDSIDVLEHPVDAQEDIISSAVLPTQLEHLVEKVKSTLSQCDVDKLRKLLIEYQDVFAKDEFDLGSFQAIKHQIDTANATPIKLGLRRTPVHFVKEEDELLQNMLKAGVIQPSNSSWAAAPVLVRKKDGRVRWCIDYRALNNVTRKDVFPLPIMSECIDALEGNMFFSKLDSNSAYWQIPMHDDSKHKTAFRTRHGLFEFNKLPFGLTNSPSTYSRVMNLVLRGLNWKIVLAFLDDILVLGLSIQGHLDNLREVFARFRQYGLKLKPKKCDLFQTEVEFLGRKVGRNGISLTEESIAVIRDWPTPRNCKDVERYVGLVNFHRSFIKELSGIIEPISRLLKKKEFVWTDEQQRAFEKTKVALTTPPVLTVPTSVDKFILDTDASDVAIGAELLQVQNGEERVIAYGSFTLTAAQRNYCTTRKELLAVVRFTNQFRHYLLGREFVVRTDHHSLTWLFNFRRVEGQLARWLEALSQFAITIEHRAGKKHLNADALSRPPGADEYCPYYTSNRLLEALPCGGCRYCVRMHTAWSQFEKEIDNVIPLPSISRIRKRSPRQNMEIKGITVNLTQTSSVPGDDTLLDAGCLDICSKEGWEKEQKDEVEFQFLRPWIINRDGPSQSELTLASSTQKFYWLNKELFYIVDGLLIYQPASTNEHKLVVPSKFRKEILRLCHDIPSSGHQGNQRTKCKVQERYFWHKLSRDVKGYVLGCSVCNRNKSPSRKNKSPLVLNQAGVPMEKVHIDFVGPLPRSRSGNEYILVMIDQFTRWLECIPLPSQGAEVTARAAVNEFFTRFGYPLKLVSDQGANFESSLFKAMCKLLQIHKSRTTAYRPSANGQVERMNRTLMAAVRSYCQDYRDRWDEFVPLVASAIRGSVNRQTGYTPNKLMLGRELNAPLDLVIPGLPSKPVNPDEYVRQLQSCIEEAHEIARKTLRAQVKTMKRDYDLKMRVETFRRGDAVYLLDKKNSKHKKLKPVWIGPAIVTTVFTPFVLGIKLQNREVKVVAHDQLKRCSDFHLPRWILKEQDSISSGKALTYCLCDKPDDGTTMIRCDACHEWYHGRCVNLTDQQMSRIGDYFCPRCGPT